MKFKYELQTLLDIKKQLEASEKNQLSKRIKILEQEKQALQALYHTMAESRMAFSKNMQESLSIEQFKQFNNYLSILKIRIKSQQANVDKAAQAVEEQRQVLIKVSKEKKMLETLKDKKFELYKQEQLKEEEKIIGEVVGYRYIKSATT